MIDALPEYVGALVRWDDSFVPEYGLLESYNGSGTAAWVRFDLGDTPQSCPLAGLTLMVPAIRPSDRSRMIELVEEAVAAADGPSGDREISALQAALEYALGRWPGITYVV